MEKTSSSFEEVLAALSALQKQHELCIMKISEPIASISDDNLGTRTSDVSAEAFYLPSPVTLASDLEHYKDLFSKLRFSYLEQVTKEKFIRAIVSDPPITVDHQENLDLESRLVGVKTDLKSRKQNVANMIQGLEKQGRDLSRRYDSIQVQTTQVQDLPARNECLQNSIEALRANQQPAGDPLLNMSLEKSLSAKTTMQNEQAKLNAEIDELKSLLPRKTQDRDRIQAELRPLEKRRSASMASAKDAQRRREQCLGGAGDDLEEHGRWLRGVESGLKGMLEIDIDAFV